MDQFTQPATERCTECGGETIWVDVSGPVPNGPNIYFTRQVPQGKNRWGFDTYKANQTGCKARICVQCGFAKFYAADPQKLMEA